jgi:hypothetical protein
MRIDLIFENGQSTTVMVASNFSSGMIRECYLGKDYKGMGIVVRWSKCW